MVVLSAMPRETSQLTAIMLINIVEYTRLMGQYLAKALFQALIRIESGFLLKTTALEYQQCTLQDKFIIPCPKFGTN
jgi:hypothetical protein